MRTRLGGIRSHLVLLAALLVPGTLDAQTQKKFLTGPLVIEDQGSFFIGGVPKVGEHAVRPPSGPVIMVHGSSHTAACLESTPDGREGWYPYFVRKGISTYIVDQAGRGRSGFDASVIHEAEARLEGGDTAGAAELMPSFGRITDNGAWTAWFGPRRPSLTEFLPHVRIPSMKAVKVTSKGQITIPVEIRLALGIDEHCYLEVSETGDEIRLRKIVPARPLGSDDPIWALAGSGASGQRDISVQHDRHLAEGEIERWRESS